jgi:hypothetical protein
MSSVELVSVHVPKTGGTAFRMVLESVYGADRLHTVYPQATDHPTELTGHEEWLEDSLALCRLGPSGPRVIHGHYKMSWYAERFPHAPAVTWLRHPVDRVVSFYYMWREMATWPRASPLHAAVYGGRVDLPTFVRSPAMRDQVTRRFIGTSNGAGLTFIGIQERFDEDLSRLRTLLGWPAVEAPRVNVNETAAYASRSIDSDFRDEIARLNPNDMRLYQSVLEGRWRPARS